MEWLKHNLIAVVLIVAIAVGFAIAVHDQHAQAAHDHQALVVQRGNLVKGCRKVNDLRKESNKRLKSHRADTMVLKDFLQSAAVARKDAFQSTHTLPDRQAYRAYTHLVHVLTAKVHFHKVKLVNCTRLYPPIR